MSVKERLKSFIRDEGLSIRAFEESINVSNGYVNSISKGIGSDKIEIILENYPNLNLEWLLTGKFAEDAANEPDIDYKIEGPILDAPPLFNFAIVIPSEQRKNLEQSYFDCSCFNDFEKEKLAASYIQSSNNNWFKVEIIDSAMDNGAKYSLTKGDWVYCKSISKKYWKDGFKVTADSVFCFFHNERGIIFRKIKAQNALTGELTLKAINDNKYSFPDFKIKISECSFICNVITVLSAL